LVKQEDNFNQQVNVVVENDTQQVMISNQIRELNERLDKIANNYESKKGDFQVIKSKRRAHFINYFDSVNETLKTVYSMLTDLGRLKGAKNSSRNTQGGTASISLIDRENPFYEESELNEVDKLA